MSRFRLALIAHDRMKDRMVEWAERHRKPLAMCDIVSTGTTGCRILERVPELTITRMKSGPLGGDQQIGALMRCGRGGGKVHGLGSRADGARLSAGGGGFKQNWSKRLPSLGKHSYVLILLYLRTCNQRVLTGRNLRILSLSSSFT